MGWVDRSLDPYRCSWWADESGAGCELRKKTSAAAHDGGLWSSRHGIGKDGLIVHQKVAHGEVLQVVDDATVIKLMMVVVQLVMDAADLTHEYDTRYTACRLSSKTSSDARKVTASAASGGCNPWF